MENEDRMISTAFERVMNAGYNDALGACVSVVTDATKHREWYVQSGHFRIAGRDFITYTGGLDQWEYKEDVLTWLMLVCQSRPKRVCGAETILYNYVNVVVYHVVNTFDLDDGEEFIDAVNHFNAWYHGTNEDDFMDDGDAYGMDSLGASIAGIRLRS